MKWGYSVRGEVATGGWDHLERVDDASDLQGLIADPVAISSGAVVKRMRRETFLREWSGSERRLDKARAAWFRLSS